MRELFLGGCLDVLPTLAAGSVDMILADPPYGKTRNAWDKEIPTQKLWPELWRVLKPNGVIALTAQTSFFARLAASSIENFRYDLVWEKTRRGGFLNANKAPLRSHENVLVFYKKAPTYHPQKTTGHPKKTTTRKAGIFSESYGESRESSYSSTERYPGSVLRFASERGLHPTQKPKALMRYLIETYTNEDEVVLDFCTGSATTCLAAYELGRGFIGIEKDPDYYLVAVERLQPVWGSNA